MGVTGQDEGTASIRSISNPSITIDSDWYDEETDRIIRNVLIISLLSWSAIQFTLAII